MRRAAVSIPANIAEGAERTTQKEFEHFLSIARGSLAELRTLLRLAKGLNYGNRNDLDSLDLRSVELAKSLNALLSALNRNPPS